MLTVFRDQEFSSDQGSRAVKRIADVRFQLLPQNEEMMRTAGREPAILRRGLTDLEAKFTLAREQASLT